MGKQIGGLLSWRSKINGLCGFEGSHTGHLCSFFGWLVFFIDKEFAGLFAGESTDRLKIFP